MSLWVVNISMKLQSVVAVLKHAVSAITTFGYGFDVRLPRVMCHTKIELQRAVRVRLSYGSSRLSHLWDIARLEVIIADCHRLKDRV